MAFKNIPPPSAMDYSEMMDQPDTPLSAYSPGMLAKLSPQQRAQLLKKKKGAMPPPGLMGPQTPLSNDGEQ